MVIIEREGKYFLQISNGELELSEDQAKIKLEKGQAVLKGSHEARLEHMSGPETDVATEPEKPAPISEIPREAQAFILSDEYYDNIIREFEKVYVANGRKDETAIELLDHCQRSIDHLKVERAQPGANLAVLDYQRLCWLRIIIFLQAMTGVPAPTHPDVLAAEKEKVESERNLVKQLLVIQLLQETGAFPYADALKSITHDSIVGLIARILNKDKSIIKSNMQRSGDILLRRNVTDVNAPKRLKLLTDVEVYFADLPYNHVIIRLKSLKDFYNSFNSN